MKIALIQPYFFPSITFFQLLCAVDTVVLDDTGLIAGEPNLSRAWILGNKVPTPIELDVEQTASKYIKDLVYKNPDEAILSILNKLTLHYVSAKYYHDVMDLVEKVVVVPTNNLLIFNMVCLASVLGYLQLTTEIKFFSQLVPEASEEHILRIPYLLKATNGTELIDLNSNRSKYQFLDHKTAEVRYIQTTGLQYTQFNNPFVPDLSILDYLFFHHPDSFKEIKTNFRILI